MVKPVTPQTPSTGTPGGVETTPVNPANLRARMQTARIGQRMSIIELAERVNCDRIRLAAFEHGTEIVDEETQRRIQRVLNL